MRVRAFVIVFFLAPHLFAIPPALRCLSTGLALDNSEYGYTVMSHALIGSTATFFPMADGKVRVKALVVERNGVRSVVLANHIHSPTGSVVARYSEVHGMPNTREVRWYGEVTYDPQTLKIDAIQPQELNDGHVEGVQGNDYGFYYFDSQPIVAVLKPLFEIEKGAVREIGPNDPKTRDPKVKERIRPVHWVSTEFSVIKGYTEHLRQLVGEHYKTPEQFSTEELTILEKHYGILIPYLELHAPAFAKMDSDLQVVLNLKKHAALPPYERAQKYLEAYRPAYRLFRSIIQVTPLSNIVLVELGPAQNPQSGAP